MAHWPIQSRAAELGRLLFAMLAPQCCALVIAPARKDRVDGSPRPSGLNDNHVASDRPSIGGEYSAPSPSFYCGCAAFAKDRVVASSRTYASKQQFGQPRRVFCTSSPRRLTAHPQTEDRTISISKRVLCITANLTVDWRLWVIRDRTARSCLPVDVRFPPKDGVIGPAQLVDS